MAMLRMGLQQGLFVSLKGWQWLRKLIFYMLNIPDTTLGAEKMTVNGIGVFFFFFTKCASVGMDIY